MKWFQHDSDASTDAKIKKLILRHGAEGYAVYFHCLELIASGITKTNITFQLEHDSEIIADNLKITGTSDTSAIDKVNKIMMTIIDLGLFSMSNNMIFCFKMAERLDNTVSRSPEINTIKKNVSNTNLLRSGNVAEEITLDEMKVNESKVDKIKSNEIDNIYNHWQSKNLTNHIKLTDKFKTAIKSKIKEFDIETIKKAIDDYDVIFNSDDYILNTVWGIDYFLKSKLDKFTNGADPYNFYKSFDKKAKQEPNKEITPEEFEKYQDRFKSKSEVTK